MLAGRISTFALALLVLVSNGAAARPFANGSVWKPVAVRFRVMPAVRPAVAGTVVDYVVPKTDQYSSITAIVQGPDGNEWFYDNGDKLLGKLSPNGVITEFASPPGFNLVSLVTAYGSLWTTDLLYALYRIAPSGTFTSVPIPSRAGAAPDVNALANGTHGDLWIADYGQQAIAHVTPPGKFAFYPTPGDPFALTFDTMGRPNFLEDVPLSGQTSLRDLARMEPDRRFSRFPIGNFTVASLLTARGDVLFLGGDYSDAGVPAVERYAPNGSSTIVDDDRYKYLQNVRSAVAVPNGTVYLLAGNSRCASCTALQAYSAPSGPFFAPIGEISPRGVTLGSDRAGNVYVATSPYDGHAHLQVFVPRR